ncbi:MAG: hypothetical protein O3C40_10610 [Planctomycetota bacterium]|nr:hypothetical protein [Planctomycetota bacterium]
MRFFRLYQYLVPTLLFPFCYWLWLIRYNHDHRLTLLVLSIPIVFSYVVPGLGTNWLKIWEFNTRWRLVRFRPQHGFLFGTATSLFGLLCLGFPPRDFSALEIIRSGFVMGSVLAFWNWLYDVHAIRVGFLVVYNLAYSRHRGPEAIATEYCPVFFGIFGLCYGMAIRVCEYYLAELGRFDLYWLLLVSCHVFVLASPVVAYILLSLLTTGETGLRSFQDVSGNEDAVSAPQTPGGSVANRQESSPAQGTAR